MILKYVQWFIWAIIGVILIRQALFAIQRIKKPTEVQRLHMGKKESVPPGTRIQNYKRIGTDVAWLYLVSVAILGFMIHSFVGPERHLLGELAVFRITCGIMFLTVLLLIKNYRNVAITLGRDSLTVKEFPRGTWTILYQDITQYKVADSNRFYSFDIFIDEQERRLGHSLKREDVDLLVDTIGRYAERIE